MGTLRCVNALLPVGNVHFGVTKKQLYYGNRINSVSVQLGKRKNTHSVPAPVQRYSKMNPQMH